MNLRELRIGYLPARRDLSAPADRRRFAYYARKRNLRFELADPTKAYDIVVLTQVADVTVWPQYRPGRAKVVYDCVDSYLSIPRTDLKNVLRGAAKFATRQTRGLQLDYQAGVRALCRRADAVVCSTEEQRTILSAICPNVHIVLDVHQDAVTTVKQDYSRGRGVHVAWEGLAAGNLPILRMLRAVLEPLGRGHETTLHLVTDITHGRFHDRYLRVHTADEVRRIFDGWGGRTAIYQWNERTFASIVTACDIAVIPIPLGNAFLAGKPENKLLLLWRLGMPVIVSGTPAYQRAMAAAGLPMSCRTQADWEETIDRYVKDPAARREAGTIGRRFAEEQHGEEQILERWDGVLASVL